VTRVSEALTAYRICARAEGKSPRTIGWVTSSVGYFARFLGGDPDISSITADDLRRFIITLQNTCKFRDHPFNKPQETKISALSIQTYCRGIRAFFGSLLREGLIEANPVTGVKMPRAPIKVVATFSEQGNPEAFGQSRQEDRYRLQGLRPDADLSGYLGQALRTCRYVCR
jgi:site-specific recombinase XerD